MASRRAGGTEALFSERILYIELIYEPIFDDCSAATLLRIARTCRAARYAIAAYCRVAFNIDRLLSRFFPSPTPPCCSICHTRHEHSQIYDRARAFRSLQARTGTLISGSCALQFFDRTVYPESDLDLYVHMRDRREVGRWLIQEGYTFVPNVYQSRKFEEEVVHGMSQRTDGIYRMPGVAAILTFKKSVPAPTIPAILENEDTSDTSSQSAREHCELKVQIIVAKNTPMEVILGFHSTCVMNVISYEKAYCLFPQATLEERISLLMSSCRGRSRYRAPGVAKYHKRGFSMITAPSPDDVEPDPMSTDTPTSYPYRLVYIPSPSELSRTPHMDADADDAAAPQAPPTPPSGEDIFVFAPRVAPSSGFAHKPPFRLGWRWIDDSASWVFSLPLTGIAPPPPVNTSTPALTHDPVAVCNFELLYEGARRGAVMNFQVTAGKVLRYRYLVTDESLLAFLKSELSERACAEERKQAYELDDWTYYDEELPTLCRQFLHGLASRRLASLRV
ncbi:hypothetical protein C8Q73DRAFT_743368 [Cubamyces lactineus]|nr:hypothetical protein C8Q73DRAFT_743368 [Cubamyces lactineus]